MDNKKSIVLIGMSGVGKTSVGKELLTVLNDYEYIDTDEKIEEYAGQKISDIFKNFGESFFRNLEKETIKRVLKPGLKQIISLGGGAFEDEKIQELLLGNTTVIYLKSSAREIYNRIKHCKDRPLLNDDMSIERIDLLMKRRIPNYEKAHITIETTNKTIYNIVKEIENI